MEVSFGPTLRLAASSRNACTRSAHLTQSVWIPRYLGLGHEADGGENMSDTGIDTSSDGAPAPLLQVSANAAKRIGFLAKQEGNENLMLRLSVSGGGCSGFQYGFDFESDVNEDDLVFSRDGATVVVDEASIELLQGAEIDFVEDLMGAYFQVNNPNANSSCGCGASFSI